MHIEYFKDLPLSREVFKGIEELGFTTPFPIQAQAIGPLLEGRDVIGQAHTGTGKTAAFGIPMADRLDTGIRDVQGLVLEPTRELAIQTAEHIGRICKYTHLRTLPIYGGESIQRQMDALERGVHIVVGTPGRIIDHIKRGTLDLSSVKVVVLDEADRMLDMGFIKDIEYILSNVPEDRQTSLFSATMDQSVISVCDKYMRAPEKILVSKDEIALPQIHQYYVPVDSKDKIGSLRSILDGSHVERAILFCRTRRGVNYLATKLERLGYNARALHGGLTQSQRNHIVESFRRGDLRLLIATDVAARGLDIQGITHIINYDVPMDALVYFHRIGRTARMEGEGTAITLVDYQEIPDFNRIRSLTHTRIEKMPTSQATYRDLQKMHTAVCSDCGKECEIPFKPNPGRPVYCKECYEAHKSPIMRIA
ncbi:MAG: ATP-dependent helicase DeaD [Thermoproteota archaeon]|nr:ATP-dependent helicase DeaD [Thermoproteota archaeon]